MNPGSDQGSTLPLTPFSRRAAGAVCLDGSFHVYGGFGVTGTVSPQDVGSDLWRFQDGWTLLGQGPYGARYPALCAHENGLFLFGGCTETKGKASFSDQLWRFAHGAWSRVDTGAPGPEPRYTSALATVRDHLVLFGGNSQDPMAGKRFFGDLWTFSLADGQWRRVHGPEQGPGPRYGFGWTARGDTLYVFGGFDGHGDRSDLWALHMETLSWELLAGEGNASGPCARYCPALGMVDGEVVLFGGRSKVRPRDNFHDTWLFSGQWRRPDLEVEPGYHAKPAYASDDQGLWLFGGEGPKGHVSDLWTWNGNGWHRIHPPRDDDPVLW